jgi:hypothetical protein
MISKPYRNDYHTFDCAVLQSTALATTPSAWVYLLLHFEIESVTLKYAVAVSPAQAVYALVEIEVTAVIPE